MRLIIFLNPLRYLQFWKRMNHPILPLALLQCPRPPVANFINRTGPLQQFQCVTPEDDDDKPTGLAAMDLGVEDDSICITLWKHYVLLARRLGSSSCFGWMKRLYSHTQLVRLQQVN
ncbi:hypothetical protein ACN42_g10578 [Penicillium freii]|uniref:Uncharacterized protein n=1 Tax=Penicillium freii TaxID=48697 RepID=A0A101M9T0_PENFR|nr:hypothetical protein ACN42_g10578 [Penicillium freii]